MNTNTRFVKDLTADDSVLLTELMKTYLFGNTPIRHFTETQTYNQGDVAIFYGENGNLMLKQPLQDGVSGVYDALLWNDVIISELIWRTVRNLDLVLISPHIPTQEKNRVWYQPLSEYYTTDFTYLFDGVTGVNEGNDEVAISDTRPINITNIYWYEAVDIREEDGFSELLMSGFAVEE